MSHRMNGTFLTVQHQFGGDFVPATCPMKFGFEVQQAELHGRRRGDKITPKLVLHSYKKYQFTRGDLSLQHITETCTRNIFTCVPLML